MDKSREMIPATRTRADIFDPKQEEAYQKLIAESGGIIWMRVGDGKTRVALMAAMDIAQDSGHKIIIVICRRAAFYDWQQEIATLQLDVDVEEIENYVGFNKRISIVLVSDGMLLNSTVQQTIMSMFAEGDVGAICVDELWLFKNPKAKKHLALRVFTEVVPTIGLSGSVMTARDLVDIFGQVAAVGRMKQLAHSLTRFRETYQTGIQGAFFSWYPKPGAYKAIMAKIEPFVYVHMPPTTQRKMRVNILKVLPTKQQKALIKELKETAAIEGKFELVNMANIITKAQQISNGWIKDDQDGYEYIPSAKVDRCVALVDEILEQNETEKVVIWCAFRQDILRLIPPLSELGFKIATLQSGTEFNTKLWAKKDCRICLATEASGTSVNHFAQCQYGIYFSQDFKWTSLQQSQGRHTRRSSLHETAYFTFLHTEKSLDAQVFYTVRTSASSESSFVKQMGILEWLKERNS